MDAEQLRQLPPDELAQYLWARLRRESPMDPPLSQRFDDEEPERFVIQVASEPGSRTFRSDVLNAVHRNLTKLAAARIPASADTTENRVDDEHVASLAFIISELDARELIRPLYLFACGWFLTEAVSSAQPSFGQTHVLRTLAQLQPPDWLGNFWRSLWERGPRGLRGLTIFGWARADQIAALRHLGELADSAAAIDLPGACWSLIGPEGPGIIPFAQAAAQCTDQQRSAVRQALVDAGAEDAILRDFDLQQAHVVPAAPTHNWLDDLVPAPAGPRHQHPAWGRPVAAAA